MMARIVPGEVALTSAVAATSISLSRPLANRPLCGLYSATGLQALKRTLPGIDFSLEFCDLKNPFLTRDGIKSHAFAEYENHITRCNKNQFSKRSLYGRKDLTQRTDRGPDPLYRNTGINQSFRSL
jgi:hypothetical protein